MQATRVMTLCPIASLCASGECPTIYRTDRGTLVVQGYAVDPAGAGLESVAGMQLVEIPVELLMNMRAYPVN
jgi:hypothetical protein